MFDNFPGSPKEKLFCLEYIVDLNGTQAAIRASYSAKSAGSIAYDLLKKPYIESTISQLMAERALRTQASADMVLLKLQEAVTCDISTAFDPVTGALLPINKMPKAVAWLLAGFETDTKYDVGATMKKKPKKPKDGEAQEPEIEDIKVSPSVTTKIKLLNRLEALKMLGDHIKVQAFKQVIKREDVPVEGTTPMDAATRDKLIALADNLSVVEALASGAGGAIPVPDADPAPPPAAAPDQPGTVPGAEQPFIAAAAGVEGAGGQSA